MRIQKVIDFNNMIKAIDVICRFCEYHNCSSCGANLTITSHWEELSAEQKLMCECPWNGIQT